ncbi:MAG: hypothetical protein ABFR02_08275 [Campylobacterota bacterium]
MLIEIIVLIAVIVLVFFAVAILKFKNKPSKVETVVKPQVPALEVLEYKKGVQAIIDHYRKMIETKESSSDCKALAAHVIGKVEDVTIGLDQQDVKQYANSLMIRLEAFRAAYGGEPSYAYNCDVSRSTDFSNTLINAILKYIQKRILDE